MSNALKGMIGGFVGTVVLSVLMVLNGSLGLFPQIDIIRLLTTVATLSVASAWMDHFIIGVVIWGLMFAAFDAITTGPAPWIKGIIFGIFAWLMMMLIFMPLAGSGVFGVKVGVAAVAWLLFLHLVYGVVLGTVYGLLGLVPVRAAAVVSPDDAVLAGPDATTMSSADINNNLPSSSPSGKTVLIVLGSLAGFFLLLVLLLEFRKTFGF